MVPDRREKLEPLFGRWNKSNGSSIDLASQGSFRNRTPPIWIVKAYSRLLPRSTRCCPGPWRGLECYVSDLRYRRACFYRLQDPFGPSGRQYLLFSQLPFRRRVAPQGYALKHGTHTLENRRRRKSQGYSSFKLNSVTLKVSPARWMRSTNVTLSSTLWLH